MPRKMAALIFGNAAYADGNALTNPSHDAADLAARLRKYGFEVIVGTDCTSKEMDKNLKAFSHTLDTHDVGLFFFAGHGMQMDGCNYLLAIDTDMDSETDAKHSSLSLDKVVEVMAKSPAATKIVILDACRNNPWERRWRRSAGQRGLASVYAPKGTIIGFATSPGQTASDGAGRNGTYTSALLKHIDAPDCTIEAMFKKVRNTVAAASGGKQTTWEHTSLSGEFYFNLSLGKVVDEYSDKALADEIFVLDESKKSHKIIAGLKTLDWYRQNPALQRLDATLASKAHKDSLFVLGRNIYQAACGTANEACDFVKNFFRRTQVYDPEGRKAILDGMLFEVFFDRKAKLRERIKKGAFDDLFELQQHETLKESFDFIAATLTAAGGDFYVLPGKGHTLAVTVATKHKRGVPSVSGVYVGGTNVLKPTEDAWMGNDGEPHYIRIDSDWLKSQLSEELAVPLKDLEITYEPAEAETAEEIRYPINWSVRKMDKSCA